MSTNTDFLKIERPESLAELYTLKPFNNLILSFCADTPRGSTVEIQARVRLLDGTFTQWFSWGIWSPFADRHSINAQDDYAVMDTDTLRLKEGRLADTVQLRILFTANDQGEKPVVRRVILASKNTQQVSEEPLSACEDVYVQTPCYSQMVRDPRIGHVICSATTISMLLNQKGENVLPEEVALHNYDSAYDGCGNWSFSTAIAASYGYDAYVRYATLDDLVEEIKRGNAVGISVHYANTPDHPKHPYIEGAPCTTPGHLLVLCGFQTASNGSQYAIVHDPAAPDNGSVERLYPLEAFLAAWNNRVCYFVRKEEQDGCTRYIPSHIPARLTRTETAGQCALEANGKVIALPCREGFPASVAAFLCARKGEKDADCDYAYGQITPQGLVTLPEGNALGAHLITNHGDVYEVNEIG